MRKILYMIVLLPSVAHAQAAAPDISAQIANYAGLALASFVVALATWAAKRYLGINLDQKSQDTLEAAMQNGIALGISRVAPAGVKDQIDKSKVVGIAMDYVQQHVPDAADRLNVDAKALAEKLEARLVQHPASAAVSPATAAAPPPAEANKQ